MTEEINARSNLTEIVKKADKILSKKYPKLTERLNPGATDLQISEFESEMGFALQPELVEAYKIHDGEKEFSSIYGGWRWLPLSGIKEQIENFLILEKEGYAFGYESSVSVPIFYNDDGVLYIEKGIENSAVFLRDNDYPEKKEPVSSDLCEFFNMFLNKVESDYFNYSEHKARENNIYIHLWPGDGKPWP